MREDTENWEAQWLSPRAALSVGTRGREKPIEPCPLRTDYQRDRDRIIHCKSFRRLKYKTQVFLSPEGDHYRTRLTHTLEVSQIARTIARALRLNEDLTEAIALGHDLGHTPFGHVGESVLDELMPGGFAHNEQSRRIVEKLENGRGLNLTWEVRDGIRNHKMDGRAATLEGRIVSFADRIAYINHDIDDAIRAGVLKESQLPRELMRILGGTHGQRINCMILDIVKNSESDIAMSPEVGAATDALRDFMFAHVYTDPVAKSEESKAKHVIEMLYAHYKKHVDTLPQEFTYRLEEDGDAQVAGDYIACMTDRYAIHDYERLFVPQAWTHA